MRTHVRSALAAFVAVLLSAVVPAVAHEGGHYGPMDGWHDHWFGTGWWDWIGMLAFLALLGVVVAVAVAMARRRNGEDAALRTLRERYARGDIDESEYEARRDRLS